MSYVGRSISRLYSVWLVCLFLYHIICYCYFIIFIADIICPPVVTWYSILKIVFLNIVLIISKIFRVVLLCLISFFHMVFRIKLPVYIYIQWDFHEEWTYLTYKPIWIELILNNEFSIMNMIIYQFISVWLFFNNILQFYRYLCSFWLGFILIVCYFVILLKIM